MTSTTPAAGPADLDDRDGLWSAWASSADDIDALELAARIRASFPAEARTDNERAAHARLLLLLGRPDDALAVMPPVDRATVLAGHPHGWVDVVTLACWTAQGDADARGALLRWGSGLPAGHALVFTELLTAAATQAGELTLADDAALRLPARATPWRLRQRVTAFMRQRPQQDPAQIAATVVDCAQALLEVDPPADDDPALLEQVLDDLELRGDTTGPTLLLNALDRQRPGSPVIESLLKARAMRPHPWLAVLPLLAALVLSVLLVWAVDHFDLPGVIFAAGVPGLLVSGWQARPQTYPHLPVAEYRAIRQIRRGESFGSTAATVAGGILGGVVGVIFAVIAWMLLAELFMPGGDFGENTLVDLSFWFAIIAGAVAGPLGMLRLRRRSLATIARRRRAAAEHRDPIDADRCACWQPPVLRGPLARRYADGHLRPGAPAIVAGLDLGANTRTEARECPDLGLRWLLIQADTGPEVLLPGTVREQSAPEDRTAGTGGYL